MKITQVQCRAFQLPLKERLISAKFTLTHRELIVLTLETDTGLIGTGWCTTPGSGALAARALIESYLVPLLIGEDPRNNERIWNRLWTECHYSGAGGLTTLAIAPIDIAIWDIKAKLAGEPLHRLLGGSRTQVPVYASAINLHLDREALLAQTEGFLTAGYTAFKLKIGRRDFAEDMDRCRAVRALIGSGRDLCLDVNQKWTPAEAIQRCRSLAEVMPAFIEEPTLSDDVAGHAAICRAGDVPVAVGEQLGNRYEFWNYVRDRAADILQPCPFSVGGITEWMKIAALAQCSNLTISPHGALELSTHLAGAITHSSSVENIFTTSLYELGVCTQPIRIENGLVTLNDTPGHGVVFDGPALREHEVSSNARIDDRVTMHAGL